MAAKYKVKTSEIVIMTIILFALVLVTWMVKIPTNTQQHAAGGSCTTGSFCSGTSTCPVGSSQLTTCTCTAGHACCCVNPTATPTTTTTKPSTCPVCKPSSPSSYCKGCYLCQNSGVSCKPCIINGQNCQCPTSSTNCSTYSTSCCPTTTTTKYPNTTTTTKLH
jgi:hypothetical protein